MSCCRGRSGTALRYAETVYPENARRARWGLLAAALVLAGLAIGLTAWSHAGLVERLPDLYRAQAEVLHLTRRSKLPPQPFPPTEQEWAEVFAELQEQGLVWLAMMRGPGEVSVELGLPAGPVTRPPRPGELVEVGEAVRMSLPGRHRDVFVMDFEPTVARELLERSRFALWAAVLVGLLLVAGALFAFRASLRAEAAGRELEAQRHLASLGEMSAVLAHEIRNPLAALKGHAQLLEELTADRLQLRARRVVDEAQRLERLVGSLLEFARETRLEVAETELGELLGVAARDTEPERIVVAVEGPHSHWTLDGSRMRQVLVNLLSNALEASDGSVELTCTTSDPALTLTVRDSGPGLGELDPETCFEPFQTTRAQGTGLGLAIARRLVRLHGGTLVGANHAEGGALFTVTLPRRT